MSVKAVTQLLGIDLELSISMAKELVKVLDFYDANAETPKSGLWLIRDDLVKTLESYDDIIGKEKKSDA